MAKSEKDNKIKQDNSTLEKQDNVIDDDDKEQNNSISPSNNSDETYEEQEYRTEEEYRNDFLERRAQISRKTYNKGSIEIEEIYAQEYMNQCELAVYGDVVAQDLLSYWFKHGNPAIEENIELSMKWLFLAASGGNSHSITKLALFLNYAYDEVINSEYFKDLVDVLYITQENYQENIGKVICKFIVYDLKIDALELAKTKLSRLEFNRLTMQRFTQSLNRAMPKVHEFFETFVKNNKK